MIVQKFVQQFDIGLSRRGAMTLAVMDLVGDMACIVIGSQLGFKAGILLVIAFGLTTLILMRLFPQWQR
jgi:hypothetical protein